MAARDLLDDFLKRARRRRMLHLAAEHGAIVGVVAGIAAIALLLAGTQILNWPVLSALLLAAFAAGAWRLRKGFPSLYAVAKVADRNLSTHDALSTACHFRQDARRRTQLYELQQQSAADIAARAAVAEAIPFSAPRSFYVFAMVAAAAGTLFGLRYGILHTLSLEHPIAEFSLPFLREDPPPRKMASRKSLIQEKLDDQIRQLGLSPEPIDTPVSNPDRMGEMTQNVEANPDGGTPMPSSEKGARSNKPENGGEPGDESGEGKEAAGEAEQSAGQKSDAAASQAAGKPERPKQGNNENNSSTASSSLADKIRDALANLAQKIKSPGGQQQQQQAGANSSSDSAGKRQQMSAQKGTQGQGRSQPDGQPNGSQTGEQEGAQGSEAQAGQPKGAEQASDRPGSQDGKNGMGKQDGSKEIREAEQLAAMGKISEIIGKRSAQVSGEMTVEVSSVNQQLKTAYTQRKSTHSDQGGEINRDEIPLIYQSYVQRYFEEVRKSGNQRSKPDRVDR